MTAVSFLFIIYSLYFQVERSIERCLGAKVLEKFREYERIQEELIGERKEVGDKMKLGRTQMMELELGMGGWLMDN